MLSRIAAPKKSAPVSVPSSKTTTILWTVPVIGTSVKFTGQAAVGVGAKQKPITTPPTPQRSLVHASPLPGTPEVMESARGDRQPTKKKPVVVTTSKRGAPAPQCDPLTLSG